MNANTVEIVKRLVQSNHNKKLNLTNSQDVLNWTGKIQKTFRRWVRNRVVEIFRFTESSGWMFVCSQDLIAYLGTQRVDDLNLVNKDSI